MKDDVIGVIATEDVDSKAARVRSNATQSDHFTRLEILQLCNQSQPYYYWKKQTKKTRAIFTYTLVRHDWKEGCSSFLALANNDPQQPSYKEIEYLIVRI